jgi:sulfoxide reductase catalytic subunit YedY
MHALGKSENISLHHCIQGWSGVAQWGGLELKKLVELVKPLPESKTVVFYSFGEGLGVWGATEQKTGLSTGCRQPLDRRDVNIERLGAVP